MSEMTNGRAGGVMEAAQRGERWAEEEITRLVRQFARHVCRGSGQGAEPDWEDVAQEACRRVFSGALESFRPGGAERSYLYSIVKATRIQIYRSASRRQKRESAVEIEDRIEPRAERQTLLHRILSRLPQACRELLQRAFFDGASTAELSQELGLAESSVRSKLTRCLQQARVHAGSDGKPAGGSAGGPVSSSDGRPAGGSDGRPAGGSDGKPAGV